LSVYASENTPPDEVGFRDLGRLGVHQFYDSKALRDPVALTRSAKDSILDQFHVALLLQHLDQMGVSAELMQLASQTLPTEIHYLSEKELTRTRADSWSVQDLFIRGYRNGVAITELQFGRKYADYRLELYCDQGELKMLANVSWRGDYDINGHRRWKLLDNLSVPSPSGRKPIRVRKLTEVIFAYLWGEHAGKIPLCI
jgi:hypothetical protein